MPPAVAVVASPVPDSIPLLQRVKKFRKLGRERGGEAHPFVGRGVVEAEPLGVEELAAEGGDARARGRGGGRRFAPAAVGLVADHRVLDPGEVDAYLVRAARLDLHVQKREAREARPDAPERERRAPAAHDGHARAVARVARERLLYLPALLPRHAVDERGVGLEDRARAELLRQDRKSTRLNSSHANISYAVFCLKKKKT